MSKYVKLKRQNVKYVSFWRAICARNNHFSLQLGCDKKNGVRDRDKILYTYVETSSVRFIIIASYIINMFFTFNFNFPAAPFNFEVGSSFRREARIVENSDC